ncbi:MAG: hypothetical protein HOV81_21670 [Kofleriaceae bacterium]|nr:hypothetical protein [Kofleriaceae bacterium]
MAVIDLGPADNGVARQKLNAAIVKGGLQPVLGDGVEDALAGVDIDRDRVHLAAAMADAQAKFGALDCTAAVAAAQTAIQIGAARQASGLAVPELPRAWTYVLLCADRAHDTPAALAAAAHIRTLGAALGGIPDVDAQLLARYPDVDALSNRETLEIEIKAEVAGADVYVDFVKAGVSPLKVVLATGPHLIAAGSGTKRGIVTGTVVRKQPVIDIPMPDQQGPWGAVASRVAGWGGKMPSPAELKIVMNAVKARAALVRHGNTVEAWGHAGFGDEVRQLGGADEGARALADASELVALVADRVQTWKDRAPDPDRALLVESPAERAARQIDKGEKDEPTRWWVYATIGAALAAGALIIYTHDTADNTQRVELHVP